MITDKDIALGVEQLVHTTCTFASFMEHTVQFEGSLASCASDYDAVPTAVIHADCCCDLCRSRTQFETELQTTVHDWNKHFNN